MECFQSAARTAPSLTLNAIVHISIGPWQDLGKHAAAIRQDVFIREQGVPLDLEMDGRDGDALHAIAVDAHGLRVGTGRLLPDGRIGRLAVQRDYRQQGIGAQLLQALVSRAEARGDQAVCLAAQLHALPFYAAHGFDPRGEPFLVAGIAHVMMHKTLRTA